MKNIKKRKARTERKKLERNMNEKKIVWWHMEEHSSCYNVVSTKGKEKGKHWLVRKDKSQKGGSENQPGWH